MLHQRDRRPHQEGPFRHSLVFLLLAACSPGDPPFLALDPSATKSGFLVARSADDVWSVELADSFAGTPLQLWHFEGRSDTSVDLPAAYTDLTNRIEVLALVEGGAVWIGATAGNPGETAGLGAVLMRLDPSGDVLDESAQFPTFDRQDTRQYTYSSMVARDGVVVASFFDGGTDHFVEMEGDTVTPLPAVDGAGFFTILGVVAPDDVYATNNADLLHYDGAAWASTALPSGLGLARLSYTGPDDVWLYNGNAWGNSGDTPAQYSAYHREGDGFAEVSYTIAPSFKHPANSYYQPYGLSAQGAGTFTIVQRLTIGDPTQPPWYQLAKRGFDGSALADADTPITSRSQCVKDGPCFEQSTWLGEIDGGDVLMSTLAPGTSGAQYFVLSHDALRP